MIELFNNEKPFKCFIPQGNYETREKLIRLVNRRFDTIFEQSPRAIPQYDKSLTEIIKGNEPSLELRVVHFIYNVVVHEMFLYFNTDLVEQVRITPGLASLLGFTHNQLFVTPSLSLQPPCLKTISNLCVYTDIVEPSLFGDIRNNLLRLVHVSGQYGEQISQRFNSVHYFPAMHSNISSINVRICTLPGEEILIWIGITSFSNTTTKRFWSY
ncbi:hypothetical protein L596_025544 [Steinernema carpocapsae]|uniref:Uncharacterized protein n=1 Tax=Steinernema carpocapsae TaxID=34508 RepID=A0A4U5M832_STECR|nr:hypothetical protein L596_025544 [Steinernema carpocapsae]